MIDTNPICCKANSFILRALGHRVLLALLPTPPIFQPNWSQIFL